MLRTLRLKLLLSTFKYPAVGLGQWCLFWARRKVILLAFEMEWLFSTFKYSAGGLEQWRLRCIVCLFSW